jgi:uncharacterized protein involved in response to NO
VLFSARIGAESASLLDLAFPLVFLAVVAREILTGRNWRNLPMLGALAPLLIGNVLAHLDALGVAETAELGNRLGVATLLMLIACEIASKSDPTCERTHAIDSTGEPGF